MNVRIILLAFMLGFADVGHFAKPICLRSHFLPYQRYL